MKMLRLAVGLFGLLAIASVPTSFAHAQMNLQSFVSVNGSDSNACTQSAPCRLFDQAIFRTLPGGEVRCLTAGLFGSPTIAKSITIDCEGGVTSFSGSSSDGIVVDAAASDKVIMRNLRMAGYGTGNRGIIFRGGGVLEVDNVRFESMLVGISADRSTIGVLSVKNSSFLSIPTAIKLQTTAGNIIASVKDSVFTSVGTGVEAGTNVFAGVYNSTFTGLSGTAILASTATSTVYAENNVIQNTWVGISAAVASAKIRANGNTLYGNSKAFNVASGATFLSGGGNKLDINPGNPATGMLTWK